MRARPRTGRLSSRGGAEAPRTDGAEAPRTGGAEASKTGGAKAPPYVPRHGALGAARDARRLIAARARPAGRFDFSRYFRATDGLRFYNSGMTAVRDVARTIVRANRQAWSVEDAAAFADALIRDPYLEVKAVGIAALASYARAFTPKLLRLWKGWLRHGHASNWATTDDICGNLIGPLLVSHPRLVPAVARWCSDRNLWVRRASAVGLLRSIRHGEALDQAYRVARALHPDREDLIQKAVGWMLREAGKADPARLERYLIDRGPFIPRTTVRYAVERFPERKRRALLRATRGLAARAGIQ